MSQIIRPCKTNLHRGRQQHHLSPEDRQTDRRTDGDNRTGKPTETQPHILCSGLSFSLCLPVSGGHTTCVTKPGLPLSLTVWVDALERCCMCVCAGAAADACCTSALKFHSVPPFPLRSPSLPLPPLRSCSYLDLALPHAFSFLQGVCERVQHDITPGFPLLRYLAVSYPLAILNYSVVICHQSFIKHAPLASLCVLSNLHIALTSFVPPFSSFHLSGMLMLMWACQAHFQTHTITTTFCTDTQQAHVILFMNVADSKE